MRSVVDIVLLLARQNVHIALSGLLVVALPAGAAPGAHGPNGEHLDEKAAHAGGAAFPRLESHTELFELVAEYDSRQLTIMVDRYETNEPVLQGTLEVESGPIKAAASFQPASGAFVVTDPALLAELGTPGEHALVFTVMTGDEADLLDGTLVVNDSGLHDAHGHGHSRAGEYVAWGTVVLGLLAGAVFLVRKRRQMQASSGRIV